MPLSLYDVSVPVFERHLGSLSAILDKAKAYAMARKFDEKVVLGLRLFPDMFPLSRQIQAATDHARRGTAAPAGLEYPSMADTETTFVELEDRIARSLAFIRSVDRSAFDNAEEREVTIGSGSRELKYTGKTYLLNRALPNFYFHFTTAYAILRHNGLEIGKRDFLGG